MSLMNFASPTSNLSGSFARVHSQCALFLDSLPGMGHGFSPLSFIIIAGRRFYPCKTLCPLRGFSAKNLLRPAYIPLHSADVPHDLHQTIAVAHEESVPEADMHMPPERPGLAFRA